MTDNKKLNKERKKLQKGSLIYTLEIAVNPKEGTVEYIVEGLDEIDTESMNSNLEYVVDSFDEEGIKLLDEVYDIGES